MTLLGRLFPPDPRERFHEEDLRRNVVDDLYRRSATSVWFLIPSLFLFRAILRPGYEASWSVKAAFGSILIVALVRWAVILHHGRHPALDPRTVRSRYLRFHVLTTLMGWCMAATVFLADPHLAFAQLAMVSVYLTGVHSVALGSMAASPATFAQYVNPPQLALLYCLLSRPRTSESNIMLALIAFYVPVLSMMCYYAHAGVRRTMLLGFELGDLALKDSLTGLRNRRFLTEFMGHEAEQLRRSWRDHEEPLQRPPQSIGLLLLDLDFFKLVNDEHGHAAGDDVLRQFAVVLQDAVRRPDLVVRWGGEEFVVIARDLSRSAVWDVADRIRRKVEEHAFPLSSGGVLRKTCSIGFALFPFSTHSPNVVSWEQALTLADHALYHAKETGRNRVVGIAAGSVAVDKSETLMRAVKDDFAGAVNRGLVSLATEMPRLPLEQER
jgi:diguanylate cyclase (GGDEF)-like protein